MLKNKFGMLKVVALALTVLMLATLVACGDKGMDDAAIQDAINNAVQSQADAAAAEQSKLASSLLAEQEKANAEAAAAQESLKAAQEAADKAAKEAADKAAAAEKAASEAKAQAEKEASEAKAAADAAAASASAAAAAASKAQAALESSLAQSSKDALTATTAPNVEEPALKQIQADFVTLKNKYLVTDYALYLAAGQKELTNLFTLAEIELMYAKTEAQAKDIMAQLDTDVKAIENAQTRANEVAEMVKALGDIETEVFTTQAEKIVEANEALKDLRTDYEDLNQELLEKVIAKTVDLDDLKKATKKLAVLESYIEKELITKMQTLAKASKGKLVYDAEDVADYKALSETIYDAYYLYRLLAVVNGGDVAAADAPIDWAYKLTKEGEKIDADADAKHPITGKALKYELDLEAPTAYFTAEELVEIYILPTLDADFETFKTNVLKEFETALDAVEYKEHNIPTTELSAIIDVRDIDDIFEDAYDAFEADLADLTFTGSYKGNKVYNDAKKDVYSKFVVAYVDAVMAVVEESKDFAIDLYTEEVYDENVDALNEQYEEKPAILANYLAKEEQTLNKFTANVEAAKTYDYAGITAKDVVKLVNKDIDTSKFFSANGVNTEDGKNNFYNYVDAIVEIALGNFALTIDGIQDGTLGLATEKMIADLKAFRDEWTDAEGAMYDTLAQKKAGSSTATPWDPDAEPTADTWKQAVAVKALYDYITEMIGKIQAVEIPMTDDGKPADKEVNVKWKKDTTNDTTKKYSEKALYFVSADAKQYYEDMGYTEANFAGSFNDMKVFFTYEANDMPLTYTYTAEEQAIQEAETLYVDAWKNIYADVVSIMGYESTYTKKIDNADGDLKDSAYEIALADAAGSEDLIAEIETFGAVYTGNIATAATADSYKNALGGKDLYDFVKKSDTITTGAHVTVNYEPTAEQYASELFALANITAKMQAEVDTCNANAPKVATLYAYKFVAIEKVAAAVKAATLVVDAEGKQVGAPTYAYSADAYAAKTYEKNIADLVAQAEKDIKAVIMDNAEKADLTTWNGTKVWSKAKIGYSYDKAVKYIDAIVTKYIGTAGTAVVIEGTVCDYADSMIFQQYKTLIKNNYSGWANLEKAN